MDRQTLIRSLAESREDQVLLARVWDRISNGVRRSIPAATCFLTGREQVLAQRLCGQGGLETPVFFGGVPDAERKVAAYVPDYLDPEDYFGGADGPIAALRVTWSGDQSLSHRDFLGSLMGQGIKREILGDLLAGENACHILVLREMADYLKDHLTQVGRVRVQTQRIQLSEIVVPEQKVRELHDTVASMRLDSVLASGFQLSRGKAAAWINADKVEINHIPVAKPDANVTEGDVISARGLGKIRVSQVRGQTKKGRIALTLERYL